MSRLQVSWPQPLAVSQVISYTLKLVKGEVLWHDTFTFILLSMLLYVSRLLKPATPDVKL
jgi:hypothetical protein